MGDFFVSAQQLSERMARGEGLRVFDVRRPQALQAGSRFIPGSRWRDHLKTDDWIGRVAPGTPIIVACMHGHNVSQIAGARLREKGVSAQVLSGGIEGWLAAGHASIGQSQLVPFERQDATVWVTRLGPAVEAAACVWLIRRCIDPDAVVHFVEQEWVSDVADELGAIAFGVPGCALEPGDNLCFFDMILQFFDIKDAVLDEIAAMVRGAAADDPALARQAAGLRCVMLGNAARANSDEEAVQFGLPVYDALYAQVHAQVSHEAAAR